MKNPLRAIRDHFLRDLINRINDLETGMRVLVGSPAYADGERVGMNGQPGRKRIFRELMEKFRFDCIVETGTYLGDSTGYMAKASGLPVHSGELNPSLHALAKLRLRDVPGISLTNADSREFLRRLSESAGMAAKAVFFYLDAHWGKDVPLKAEIDFIASRWDRFVIMVDDFEVPWDEGYTHGHYGTLRAVDMPRLCAAHDLRVYFPTIASREEGPGATGCAIVARNGPFAEPLETIASIRRHPL